MKPLLIIDLETTGTDPDNDHVIEVGAVLFDTICAVPVACKSALVRHGGENPAEKVNGIPHDVLGGPWCIEPEKIRPVLGGMAKLCHEPPIYVAHNASFERSFLPGVGSEWICTFEDATWPRMAGETGSLVNIALAYGLGVSRAHRAIEDCLLLAALLGRVHEVEGGLGEWLARAQEPKVEIVGAQPREQNQAAKDAGFRWDGERKLWTRKVRASQADAFVAGLSFKVTGSRQAA